MYYNSKLNILLYLGLNSVFFTYFMAWVKISYWYIIYLILKLIQNFYRLSFTNLRKNSHRLWARTVIWKGLIIHCILLVWKSKSTGSGKYRDRICEWTGEIKSMRSGSRCFVGCTGRCCSIDLPWTVHTSPANRQHSFLQYQSIQDHRHWRIWTKVTFTRILCHKCQLLW